jgi:aminoglycoside phosphotransferase (APT) family kinase protein
VAAADLRRPGLDADRVGRWLAGHVDGLVGPVTFERIPGGHSNLTYRVIDADSNNYVLRRPPEGDLLSTAHDMSREWRFICALAGTEVPVAPPLVFCDDLDVTGATFSVLRFVDGLVLADPAAAGRLSPVARATAADRLVEVLVALHSVDPHAVGLGDLVRSTGFAERQLRRWHRQVHEYEVDDVALLDEVHDLLAAAVPAQSTGIVHGDYRPGNLAFGPDGTVRAVFDWELATSGDPLADLGYLVSNWQEPGDPAETPGPTTVPGFPSRSEIVEHYARLSGRNVSQVPYWVAFSRWRTACIDVGVQARYRAGQMADDAGLLAYEHAVADHGRQLEAARDALRESRI